MAGLDHGPSQHVETETVEMSQRNARRGMVLFVIYLALYGGFVLINAFRPEWMDVVLAAGINLAIWYGLALIVGALVFALFYGWLCRVAPDNGAEVGKRS